MDNRRVSRLFTPRRGFLALLLGVLLLGLRSELMAYSGGKHALPVRPVVLLFVAGNTISPGVEVKKEGAALTRTEQSLMAARTIRGLLNDSGVVSAILYQPDAAMFVRAVTESKLVLANRDEPGQTERSLIGKAAGAVYVIAVTAQTAASGPGIEIAVEGVDVETHKVWSEKTNAFTGKSSGSGAGTDPNAIPRSDVSAASGTNAENALQSAANTLVVHLLAGPFAEFARSAPPASLQPPLPVVTSPAVIVPPTSAEKNAASPLDTTSTSTKYSSPPQPGTTVKTVPGKSPSVRTVLPPADPLPSVETAADSVLAVRRQAEALLTAGDSNSAVVLLRKAVNQSPSVMGLRSLLTQAYLAAGRGTDAASEAQRALALNPNSDRASELALTRLLAQAFALNGDTTAARATYEQIIAAQPNAQWARILLANLLLEQNKSDEAEQLFRAVRRADSSNRDAALGLARLLADRSDYPGAQRELATLSGGNDSAAAYHATVEFFDERITRLGAALASNRASWEKGTLGRDGLYAATSAQSGRAAGLLAILKAAAPPPNSSEAVTRAYKRRVYAASLLSQSVSALLAFLDNNDADAGSKAALQLIEFQRELDEARRTDASLP